MDQRMTSLPGDEIETLLAACLDRTESEWAAAIAEACVRHPAAAARLRARFAGLRGLGMASGEATEVLPRHRRFGEYELVAALGAGASATVYCARQATTGKLVALKVLRMELANVDRWRERFLRELRLAESLDHPGLCRVLACGEVEGQPFLAMELVEGRTLAAMIAAAPPSPEALIARLRVLGQVARALGCAHRVGLVHRDIKPGNVLVRDDGSAVLTDLGLAFSQEEGHGLTATDTLVGSPAYLAPELIAGSSRGDVATDLYALGVTLHECIAGRLPFVGPSRAALFQRILAGARVPLVASASLRRVVATAMARKPHDRYRSAEDLASDLERCLAGTRPVAQGPSPWRVLLDWLAQNRMAAAIMLALLLGGGLAAASFWRAEMAYAQMRSSGLTAAAAAEMSEDVDLALYCAVEAHCSEPTAASRSRVYEALAHLHAWSVVAASNDAGQPAVLRDGLRLEVAPGNNVVRLIDQAGRTFDQVPHPCAVHSLAVAPDGLRFVTGGGDGVARIFVIQANGCLLLDELHGHRGLIREVGFTADGESLHTTSDDGSRRQWSCRPMLARWLHPRGLAVRAVAPLAEGALLLDQAGQASVLDAAGLSVAPPWLRDGRSVLDSSHQLLLQEAAAGAAIVDLVTGQRHPWLGTAGAPGLAAAPGDRQSMLTSAGGRIERWVLRDGRFVHDATLVEVAAELSALAVSRDGRLIAAGTQDGRVLTFDRSGRRLAEQSLHKEQVWWIVFREDGQQLLTASRDETAWLGDASLARGVRLGHGGTVLCAAFAPGDRDLVATGCVDGSARLWRRDGSEVAVLRGHRGQVEHVAFTSDGSTLFTASLDHTVRQWPMGDAALLRCAEPARWTPPKLPERYRRLFVRH